MVKFVRFGPKNVLSIRNQCDTLEYLLDYPRVQILALSQHREQNRNGLPLTLTLI